MKKYFVLGVAVLFCNISHAAVYMIDFKCNQEAYKVFATKTLEELDGEFLEGSKKLARYHDLTTGKGIVIVEADDPTLVIEFARGWSEVCDSAIVPVVDDKKAMEILTRQLSVYLLREGFNKDMVLFPPEVVIRAEKQSTLEVFCRTYALQ